MSKKLTNGHGKKADQAECQVKEMAESYRSILHNVGEDPHREGLLKTPERAAKALMFFTKGYHESLEGENRRLKRAG
jgi:GTP cyclohydrolase IA